MAPNDSVVQGSITTFWSTVATGYNAHPGNVPKLERTESEEAAVNTR